MAAFVVGGCAAVPVDGREIALTPAQAQSGTWVADLPALYAPVMACLRAHPSQPAFAGEVRRVGDTEISVRIHSADHHIFDCVIDENGTAPIHFKRVQARDAVYHAGPAFFPRRWGKPAHGACFDVAPVMTAEKSAIGWVVTGICPETAGRVTVR